MTLHRYFLASLLAILLAAPASQAADPKPPLKDGPSAPPAAATVDEAPAEPAPEAETPPSATKRPSTAIASRPSSVAVVTEPGGRKVLAIHYPWTAHAKALVEVCLVPAAEKKADANKSDAAQAGEKPAADKANGEPTPIYFCELYTPKIRDQAFKLLDATGHGSGMTYSFTKERVVYKMIGEANTLGNQALRVQVYTEDTDPAAKPAMVFLQLDAWAIHPKLLSLELSRNDFPKPGKLYVWFFRGNKVLWQEKLDWPGYTR